MWFKTLVGFEEEHPDQVRSLLKLEGEYIESRVNSKRYKCGTLEIPTMGGLKASSPAPDSYSEQLQVEELIGDVRQLHIDANNAHSVIQAASQFNLLEMISPSVTPEDGIDGYEHDHTQGPGCAIACGAGTIFRNYLVEIDGQAGQTADRQINCLADLVEAFSEEIEQGLQMKNGYAFFAESDLQRIGKRINSSSPEAYEQLKDQLRVGIQWHTEVTLRNDGQEVTQVYCSGLPIGYSDVDSSHWAPLARLVLEATYEATFYAALKNFQQTANRQLFLTLVGGGVFGNKIEWIMAAIHHCLTTFRRTPLDVKIVSYRTSNPSVQQLVQSFH